MLDFGDLRPQIIKVPPSPPPEVIPSRPGQGLAGDGCGTEIPHYCNTCNHHFIVNSSCMMRECPNCYRKWASKLAKKEALRMWAGSQLRTGTKKGFRIVHCVISIPHEDDLPQLRKTARKTAKAHGITGGLFIWHPMRKPDDQWIQDGYDHFHCIGLARGKILFNPKGSKTDIVFKVIQDARRNDLRGFQRCAEIKCCIFYLLTHCGIIKGRSAVVWFGELSYNQLSTDALIQAIPELHDAFKGKPKRLCPNCHSEDIEPAYYTDWTDGMNPQIVENWIPG